LQVKQTSQTKKNKPLEVGIQMNVSVLGLGNWGTALANHLAKLGHQVLGWCIEEQIAQSINADHRNPNFLSDVDLSPKLHATTEIKSALLADFVVLVVPSFALPDVMPQLNLRANQVLVSAVKGLVAGDLLTTLQYADKFIAPDVRRAVLSGPSFAKDVVVGKPCGIVAAALEQSTSETVAKLFSGNGMRVYTSSDPIGVELGGVIKNVIALAAGVCDGIGLGESARAAIITRGLAEMTRLSVAAGADRRTLSGLSGLGDLLMTASSPTSRNYTVGFNLGRGQKLDQIISSLGSVAEGVHTAPLVIELAKRFNVEMPISAGVSTLLSGTLNPKQIVIELLNRPIRNEAE